MIHSVYRKFSEDHGSWLIHRLHHYRSNTKRIVSGLVARAIMRLKGIKWGNDCDFFGVPHFYRERFSSIVIGNNCRFRSDQTSNLIGVNHKCILSTHFPEARIVIGDNCGFSGSTIGAASEIIIGNNVLVGANVIITDFDWHSDRSNTSPQPVVIKDNVWIGVNSTILKGVNIGENSVIGANSLVVKDIPANVIAGGNPCKVLKTLRTP